MNWLILLEGMFERAGETKRRKESRKYSTWRIIIIKIIIALHIFSGKALGNKGNTYRPIVQIACPWWHSSLPLETVIVLEFGFTILLYVLNFYYMRMCPLIICNIASHIFNSLIKFCSLLFFHSTTCCWTFSILVFVTQCFSQGLVRNTEWL